MSFCAVLIGWCWLVLFLEMLQFITIMITLHISYETKPFCAILDSYWWLVLFLKKIKFMNTLGRSYEK